MSEQQKQIDALNQATNEFIGLANQLTNERGFDNAMVSAALMTASGVYATFIAAGNNGFLAPEGVDKVAAAYRHRLDYIQKNKKQELESKGLKPIPKGEADAGVQPPADDKPN